jgi:ArsR family transcriptional regulator
MVNVLESRPRSETPESTASSSPDRTGVGDIDALELSLEPSQEMLSVFKLLSDETRLRIIFLLLQNRELNVRSLCERIGQSQPAVSHHLAMLREGSLVSLRREGKHNYYRMLGDRFVNLLDLLLEAVPSQQMRTYLLERLQHECAEA